MTSPLTETWEQIYTHNTLQIYQSSSASSDVLTCDIEDSVTCSVCGICSTNSTYARQCVGLDDKIFGVTSTDCPEGTILDRGNTCCPIESLNCAGYCNTAYSEAYDSTATYRVCCLTAVCEVFRSDVQTIDCMGVCGGAAFIDTCGVCSGGLTGIGLIQ